MKMLRKMLIFLAVSFTITGMCFGAFAPPISFQVGNEPYLVEVEDFNQDGWPDVAVANWASDDVSILMNDGAGSLLPQVRYSAGDGPFDVTSGDFDSDGDFDLAVGNEMSRLMTILRNNGLGCFETVGTYTAWNNPRIIRTVDINEDGDLDLIFTQASGNDVRILFGNGDCTFQVGPVIPVGNSPRGLEVADFDHDGHLDFAAANTFGNNVTIWLGSGNETFHSMTTCQAGNQPFGLAMGDWNSDGTLDLVVSNHYGDNISILMGTDSGNFNHTGDIPAGDTPVTIKTADFDHDGSLDLAVANQVSRNLLVLYGDGIGGFENPEFYDNPGNGCFGVEVADFDCDGYMDIITTSFEGVTPGIVSLFRNNTVCTISGTVSPAYSGLTVDVFKDGSLFRTDLTDANGQYAFPDLEPDSYIVELVVPLGFTCPQPVDTVELSAGGTETVNFTLTPIVTSNDARSKGYWKHQVNANLSGQGATDYSTTELLELSQEIFDHFYGNPVNPVQISGVTYVGNPATLLGMTNLQYMLNINQGGTTMYLKACQQYLTLLLNLASNKVGQYTLASPNGVTHSQAVVYIHDLLTAPGTNYELAKNIAETLNNAQMVANGVIPLSTPNIIFGEGEAQTIARIASFKLNAPSPNPFNPSTAISYQLQAASRVSLRVFDTAGRLVETLVNGWTQAGTHEVTFDGSNLATGVYLYTLTAGQQSATGKMLLLK